MATDIDPWITAFHRQQIGMLPNHEFTDYEAAFDDDPELLATARAEMKRLDDLDAAFGGQLHMRDYNQHTRRVALKEMMAVMDQELK